MSKYFTITLPPNSSPGPYNIYYNFENPGFLAPLYNITGFAENITLQQLITGVTIVVPDNTNVIYLYNNSVCNSSQSFPIQTPTPSYDPFCLTYTCGDFQQQFDFSQTDTIFNGKPVFSATGGYNVVWVTGNTPNYWELSGLSSPVLRSTDTNIPPTTSWESYNSPFVCGLRRIDVTSIIGSCTPQTISPTITLNVSNPSCYNLSDGGISVSAAGGTPPYDYSIDGVNYFPSPVFPNLSSSSYNVYAKDSLGNLTSQLVTLSGPSPTVHQMNFNQVSFSQIASVGNIKYFKLEYTLTPDTPLPLSTTVFFDIKLEYNLVYNQPGTALFYTSTNTIEKNGVPLVPPVLSTTPLTITSPSSCVPKYSNFAGQNVYGSSYTYQNGDTISGTSIFGIDCFTQGQLDGSCSTYGEITLVLKCEVTNVDCDCCNVIGNNLNKFVNIGYFSYP